MDFIKAIITGPVGVGLGILILLSIIGGFVSRLWRKVSPDVAMVITGAKQRVITGGAGS